MRKITAKEAKAGMELVSVEGLVGRVSPMIDIGKTFNFCIKPGVNITLLNKPKSYEGSGRCACFKVGAHVFYAWWSDFKKHTRYKDPKGKGIILIK